MTGGGRVERRGLLVSWLSVELTITKYYLVKKAKLRRTNTILHLNPSVSEGEEKGEPHRREIVDLLIEDRELT